MDPAATAAALFDSATRAFAVRLWDGTVLPPSGPERVAGEVVLATPRAVDALLPPASERRLAEAVLDGDLELTGDVVALLEAAARWEGPRPSASLAPLAPVLAGSLLRAALSGARAALAARLPGLAHTLGRDRRAVRHHYDVSDAFYRLFLDRGLVYSCAWFASGRESLDEAQQAKLDLVCRKLDLKPGERFLDVGCGWGALLVHAAERYGVGGLGITLSEHQLAEARRRLAVTPAGRGVAVRPDDYRTLGARERFDKVASVGMMEHVGRARLDEYFRAIHRLLEPGGLFLNHAIADIESGVATLPWASRSEGGFIHRTIFPDSELIPIAEVLAAAERATFEVRDVESLREHYAETLTAWLGRLERRFDEAVALVGRRTARAYRLYLASSAAAFRLARISVFQLLLAKRSGTGRLAGVPRNRGAWYAEAPEAAPRERRRRVARAGARARRG